MDLFGERRRSKAPAYVPLPPTPAISNHQLSSGWQNEGFQSSALNHTAHEIDPPGGEKQKYYDKKP
ncbi:MAG TPA: hypothetical protein VF677_10665 [Flavobacterium sp.]|jgi:hypothetical protein